ncbi:MAG: [FeFe] hydrogenase H-cluster radical SAM maturase HydE [Candidatus Cloacimonadota bacterium]|nr:MAG: [FeFe] hydrogenase H-cluster radical SAM maturase HydE [Candidatus Cloacimonadota bacterium]
MEKETFISKEEILQALKENNEKIFERADETRKVFCKDEVHIRGIIAFSNYCCRSCLYCGLRKENKQIFRYRMKPEEIVKVACEIIQNGVKTVVLQSGDDFGFSRKTLVEIINKIKKGNNVAITLSVGEKPFDDYKAFREAGADRFLLKHETSNQSLYGKLHPGQSLKERLKSLEYMKKLGYQIGAGNIIGLPGQSIDDLVNDILFLKEFDVDMAGIGPFIPQKDTPLGNYPAGDLNLTLKFLALGRIVTKNIHLPATTALGTLNPREGQLLGFKAGCNVIMPDFTPEDYRRKYVIYDNKVPVTLKKAKKIIIEAGRKVARDRGDSLKRSDYAKNT